MFQDLPPVAHAKKINASIRPSETEANLKRKATSCSLMHN